MKKMLVAGIIGATLCVGAVANDTPVVGHELIAVSVTQNITKGYRASKIIGMDVHNRSGKRVGTVDDLIVAPDDFVSYAIVNVGGFLGIGEKHVAIPVELLEDVKGKATLPGATEESLKKLPAFRYADGY